MSELLQSKGTKEVIEPSAGFQLEDLMRRVACTAFLFGVTISLATTVTASRAFIEPARQVSLALAMALGLACMVTSRKINVLLSLALLAWLTSYGMLMADSMRGASNVEDDYGLSLLVITAGVLAVGSGTVNAQVMKWIVGISVCVAIGTIAIGGLTLDGGIPRFHFTYRQEFGYSQGATMFFGVAAASATYLFVESRRKTWIILAVGMLGLSALGGARGELVAVILAMLWALRRSSQLLTFVVIAVPFIGIVISQLEAQEIVVWQRFESLGIRDDYGYDYTGSRAHLFTQALQLLADNPSHLVTGAGFGYFQYYYGHEPGNYPHNVVLESLIVFGLPQTLALAFLIGKGIVNSSSEPMKIFFVLYFINAMESGSVVRCWVLGTLCLVYAGHGLYSIISPRPTLSPDTLKPRLQA